MGNSEGKTQFIKSIWQKNYTKGGAALLRKDYTGQRFGRLIILEMLYRYKGKNTYCRCKCDCGNEKIILTSNVISGKSKSCGCFERESRYTREHGKYKPGERFGKIVSN